jgi:hypothetical protein
MKLQECKLVNMTTKPSAYRFLTIILGLGFLFSAGLSADPPQAQEGPQGETAVPTPPTPAMNVDDSRLLIKAIPSVDIPKTLGKWKLQDPELVMLRQWSKGLVDNSSKIDFVSKWTILIQQVSSRNKALRKADLAPLIQMVMLAAYEQAQKEIASGSPEGGNKSKLRKQFAAKLRENLTQGQQVENLARFARSEMTDPLTGSGLGLPTVQRMLLKCKIQDQGEGKIECNEILVSTDYELKDYISSTQNQLKQVEDELRRAPGDSQTQGEGGKARLYALAEVARQMHDAANPYLK